MANVPAIEEFANALNEVLNSLIEIREDLAATDRLWPILNGTGKAAIKTEVETKFAAAQAALAAITVP